jgi:hypothetical protein
MHCRVIPIIVVSAIVLAGCSSPSLDSSLKTLPDLWRSQYKVDPYIRAAVTLQLLGRPKALETLHKMAKAREPELLGGDEIIILCRMLFTKRAGSDFRRPMIGYAECLGGTVYSDWPLEPIEVVDGVPFFIITSIAGGGVPEFPEEYIRYCETNCEWSSYHFAIKTGQEKRKALSTFLASPKWMTPLDGADQAFLATQIQ